MKQDTHLHGAGSKPKFGRHDWDFLFWNIFASSGQFKTTKNDL